MDRSTTGVKGDVSPPHQMIRWSRERCVLPQWDSSAGTTV